MSLSIITMLKIRKSYREVRSKPSLAIASIIYLLYRAIPTLPYTSLLTPISAAEYNFCNVRSYYSLFILHPSFALVLTLLHLLVIRSILHSSLLPSISLFLYSFLSFSDFHFCAYDSSTLFAYLFLNSITRNN